jgi:hypothetical protein
MLGRSLIVIVSIAIMLVVIACGPPSVLIVQNRTTGPVMFLSYTGAEPQYVVGCETVTYNWGNKGWARVEPTAAPSPLTNATEIRIPITPPVDGRTEGTVFVTSDGPLAYDSFETIPSPPPCEGLAPSG